MNDMEKCGINDLLMLFEDTLSPSDILSSKLIAQVSAAITKERVRLQMTQSQFADYIHVTQSQISRWEHGEYNFTLEKIADIAVRLNFDVNINFKNISYAPIGEYEKDDASSACIFTIFYSSPDSVTKNSAYSEEGFDRHMSNLKEVSKYVTVC